MMETLAHLCQLLKIENCGVKYCDMSKVQPTFRIEDVCGDPRRKSQILKFAGEKEEITWCHPFNYLFEKTSEADRIYRILIMFHCFIISNSFHFISFQTVIRCLACAGASLVPGYGGRNIYFLAPLHVILLSVCAPEFPP